MKKTLSFAIIHFTVAFSLAFLLTGNILIGGLIALIEPMVNTVAFYFHEKVWQTKILFKPNIPLRVKRQSVSLYCTLVSLLRWCIY